MGWQALRSFESISSAFSSRPGQESGAYHTQTRLPRDREGLLIDIGAFDDLTGDHWLKRATT
eukprot:12935416-Prorocentrum_lima.AAC.1